jgi:recombinational DNA repair protein (RecF pathway)
MNYFDDLDPDPSTFEEEGCEQCKSLQRQFEYLNERIHEHLPSKLLSFADVLKSFDNTAAHKRDQLAKEHRELMYEMKEHIRRHHAETD